MKRWEPVGRWGRGLLVGLPLALALAGCAGTANAPDGSESGGSGLGGEMISKGGRILGNTGAEGQVVNLHNVENGSCNTASAVLQSASALAGGSFTFDDVDQGGNYCIEYGGQTHICNCQFGQNSECDCSPPAGP